MAMCLRCRERGIHGWKTPEGSGESPAEELLQTDKDLEPDGRRL